MKQPCLLRGSLQLRPYPTEVHNNAELNLVTLSQAKGERNGEYKASLNSGGGLPTRPSYLTRLP